MAKKKKPRLVKVGKKRENKEPDHLPEQSPEQLCFYNTTLRTLKNLDETAEYREGLSKLKIKFLWEIQEWSRRFGIEQETRIYFEIKSGE